MIKVGIGAPVTEAPAAASRLSKHVPWKKKKLHLPGKDGGIRANGRKSVTRDSCPEESNNVDKNHGCEAKGEDSDQCEKQKGICSLEAASQTAQNACMTVHSGASGVGLPLLAGWR